MPNLYKTIVLFSLFILGASVRLPAQLRGSANNSDGSENAWPLIKKILDEGPIIEKTSGSTTTVNLIPQIGVLGFEPDSVGENVEDFKVLSGLCVNAYSLSGNGKLWSIYNNNNSIEKIYEIIKNHKDKKRLVRVTIPENNVADQNNIFRLSYAQSSAIEEIQDMLISHHANVLVIDFPGIEDRNSEGFVKFITKLKNTLKLIEIEVYVIIPPIDPDLIYDLSTLKNSVDKFIIDFARIKDIEIPIIPLETDSKYSFAKCIKNILDHGVSPSKLIAGISNSGIRWTISPVGQYLIYDKKVSYSEIDRLTDKPGNNVQFDELSGTAKLDVYENGEFIYQIWFDNAAAIAAKCAYVKKNGLAGVAYIDMGDNTSYEDMWSTLAVNCYKLDTTITYPERLTFIEKVVGPYSLWNDSETNVVGDDYRIPEYLVGFIVILIAILLIIICSYYYLLTKYGVLWKLRKLFIILIFIWSFIVLSAVSLFAYLNPAFGIGVSHTPKKEFTFL